MNVQEREWIVSCVHDDGSSDIYIYMPGGRRPENNKAEGGRAIHPVGRRTSAT